MPIRLNLLAEAQAAEELRRRDPVKRAVLIGVLVVGAVLLWSSWLQFSIFYRKLELNSAQAAISAQTRQYQQVVAREDALREINQKLAALHQLATNRFLWGTVLNVMQQTAVDDVQLMRFKGDQAYAFTEGTKPSTNDVGKIVPGRPATATERVVLTLDAKDIGPGEGDTILHYMETLGQSPFFQEALGKTNKVRLANQAPPQEDSETGRKTVKFALECRFSEKTR
jgi:cell division protein FtsB